MTKRFVMKNLFYFPKVLGSGRIQVSSDTNRMELIYACPKRNLKGITDTRISMWILLGGNVLNIIGNYLLIYGKAGFPELGLKWSMP